MTHISNWSVAIYIDEHDRMTEARAELQTRDTHVTGHGSARRNPRDSEVPEIGDELAVARALADLSHKLFDATVSDIEALTHTPAYVAES